MRKIKDALNDENTDAEQPTDGNSTEIHDLFSDNLWSYMDLKKKGKKKHNKSRKKYKKTKQHCKQLEDNVRKLKKDLKHERGEKKNLEDRINAIEHSSTVLNSSNVIQLITNLVEILCDKFLSAQSGSKEIITVSDFKVLEDNADGKIQRN